jgi:hypothetical protein
MAPLIRVSRAGFVYSCLGIASIAIGIKITLWAEQKSMARVCALCMSHRSRLDNILIVIFPCGTATLQTPVAATTPARVVQAPAPHRVLRDIESDSPRR